MQYINHWPDIAELWLPEAVSQDLFLQLHQPFNSAGEAKQFWNETSSTVIILDPSDNITDLKGSDAWNQIDFTLTYPEYTSTLSMDYQSLVAIVNDSGSGIFLVVPPEMSHILNEREAFTVLYLSNRNQLISCEELFFGTIDGSTVHLREIVKLRLALNAASIICAHNHPSGVCEPSHADEMITKRIKEACALMDIKVLDHLVVSGKDAVSLAERGLI